jgi:hypothetical protein
MPGSRRNLPRVRDQVEWDTCISWRRHLVGVVNVSWSIDELLVNFRSEVVDAGRRLTGDRALTFAGYLNCADRHIEDRHPYGSCFYLLEALAVIGDDSGPDRLVIPGRALVSAFKRHFPAAPPGFERTGQLSVTAGDDSGRTGPTWTVAFKSAALDFE